MLIQCESVHTELELFLLLLNQHNHTSPKEVSCLANSISVAPAPGTKRPSFVRALKVFMPSSNTLSMSSMMLSVDPLTMMVAIELSSFSFGQDNHDDHTVPCHIKIWPPTTKESTHFGGKPQQLSLPPPPH